MRAVLDLAGEHDVEPLLGAALRLAILAARATAAWVMIPVSADVIRRAHGERTKQASEIEARLCVLGREGTIGISRAAPFTRLECERLEILARQLALVTRDILHDKPLVPLGVEIRDLRRRRIARALDRHANNASAAARELGVARSHVYNVWRSLLRSNSKCPR